MSDGGLRAALARLEIDDSYTARLSVASALQGTDAATLGLTRIRIAVLRDMTVEPLLPAVQAELARGGFKAEIRLGDFDTVALDAHGGTGPLGDFQPELILILRWLEQSAPDLATRFVTLGPSDARTASDDLVDRMRGELTAIRAVTDAPILITNFALPDLTTLGILDAQVETGHRRAIEDLNRSILEMARALPDVLVVDVARLVGRIGSSAAIDERGWHTSRAPLARPLLITLSAEVAKFARALNGRVRKCLVLDCDGTLWGGVVGEDGPSGIKLDPSYPGSTYVAFQREILNLRARGVLLAIASKNNEADVFEVLDEHPHMQIRREHLAAWRIDWEDKAGNIEAIAEELNIGLDSLVFVDDSTFECELIRSRLPDVGVLHLEGDPSTFAAQLTEPGYFDALAFSADDRSRADQYRVERERTERRAAASSLVEYLQDLAMVATIGPPTDFEIARVAQLTQKTNQFNLTTIRYTEGDIRRFVEDGGTDVVALRLRDRFADLGLVGVAIVRREGERANLDTLLMSCRVLGRGAEDAFLSQVSASAAARGVRYLTGSFVPTQKNGQVESFYKDRGFQQADDRGTSWVLELAKANLAAPSWITIET